MMTTLTTDPNPDPNPNPNPSPKPNPNSNTLPPLVPCLSPSNFSADPHTTYTNRTRSGGRQGRAASRCRTK